MTKRKQTPARFEDLVPAPYNPRVIGEDELARLQTSLFRYGDISGIVWNSRTGHVVTGHQRLRALKEKYGPTLTLDVDKCALTVPDGETFPIRVVDWDLPTEKAANIAGNSTDVSGRWDPPKLAELLEEMRADGLDVLDTMMTEETLAGILDGMNGSNGSAYIPPRAGVKNSESIQIFRIIIDCESEAHQLEVIEHLQAEGIECQALIL